MAGPAPPYGWHHRGYLPHCDHPGLTQFITFRLADALPRAVVQRLAERDELEDEVQWREVDAHLDHGHGGCLLREHRAAGIVATALQHGAAQKRYRLIAWTIMPNHVHVLIHQTGRTPLSAIVASWKGFTARRINAVTGRQGRLWQVDYFDRYIRDADHLEAVIMYIRGNPVQAGLVATAGEWPWSG
jgi:REP element-mobilizing transposase RayT